MKVNVYKYILHASNEGCSKQSLRGFRNRTRFLVKAFIHRKIIKSLINEIDSLGYSELFTHEIPLLVALNSPYIHNQWEVEMRLKVILEHYKIIKRMPAILNLADAKPRVFLDLTQYLAGMFVSLDKAKWFVREGEIVLNLFKEDQRLMSLAFTFSTLNNELVIYVGSLQGQTHSSDTLEIIKLVTKSMEGLRPADLLLEILRDIALNLGVKNILAISDENRHHRHKYFGKQQESLLRTNYNEKWIENQGILLESGFYSLPIKKIRKDITEVSSNKRALYRRRYEMLDEIGVVIKNLMSSKDVTPSSLAIEFPHSLQQKKIDLNPEKTVSAQAMYAAAKMHIKLGDFTQAKKTFKALIKEHPNLDISLSAQKCLTALEVVKAIEGVNRNKRRNILIKKPNAK